MPERKHFIEVRPPCLSFFLKNTYAPISGALPDDRSRVKVEILQRKVAFDIVREVFVFLSTEKLQLAFTYI